MNHYETAKIGQSSLILHSGGRRVDWDELVNLPTPETATKTYVPLPHARLVHEVSCQLEGVGLSVKEMALATYREGQRFFGLLGLDAKGGDGAYQVVVGLRNSHDKSFPVGMIVGSRVFVCDNLAFSSEIQVVRRHTSRLLDDLPRLVATACGLMHGHIAHQEERFEHWKQSAIDDKDAHDFVIRSFDAGVIGVRLIEDVVHHWRSREMREPKIMTDNAWKLFNAYTSVFKETDIKDVPKRTIALQGLLDIYTRFQPGRSIEEQVRENMDPSLEVAV